jgi:hypothetical protein
MNHWFCEGMWIPVGKRKKSSTSLVLNSWAKSSHTSTGLYFLIAAHGHVRFDVSTRSVIFRYRWQSRTSSLAMMLQKCMNVLVLLLWLQSRPRDRVNCHRESFFLKMTSIHLTDAYVGPPSVTAYLLCYLLSPNLESLYMIGIAIPYWDQIHLCWV